ncbi:MAG: ABC transporter permease [Treponema sp.]|nr:ABC transporter permease [Treponema sp.]
MKFHSGFDDTRGGTLPAKTVVGAGRAPDNPPNRFGQGLDRTITGIGMSAGGMLLILAVSILAAVLLVFLLSADPAKTLSLFFLGPFRNTYYFGNMLNGAVPLVFGGLGVSIAMRSGNLNLGGEGQVYSGAFVTAVTALALEGAGYAGALAALMAGAFFAGLAAALPGLCKVRWNTNELITTFLVSNTLILITNYCVTGPFLDPATSLQSTRKIPGAFHLPLILGPSNLSAAVFFALLAVVLVWVFLYRTRAGYEIRMSGLNLMFARYGGINTDFSVVLSMFLSGALHGISGGMAVYGTYFSVVKEFSLGLGWNSLAVALIARSRPALVIPAAVFFTWIASGARLAMQFSDVTTEIASIVQSVVFFLVSSAAIRDLFSGRGKPHRVKLYGGKL